ncbi:MAG: hypothetical protein E7613_00750 [Ruminococcaceae bacterium]|nr:hypothetical protein [Oscillospiraceae bacterium]
MAQKTSYDIIQDEIHAIKETHHCLCDEKDERVFSVLAVKSNLYKNPSLSFDDTVIKEILVDSIKDGGVDALLTDPNSETNNLMICQSKFYTHITFDEVRDAIVKMILFYKSMERGEYEIVNENIQRRYLSLQAEIGEESKICFVFYTSAPKNRIREDRIRKLLQDYDLDSKTFDIQLYFNDDIVDEINESKSRRPTVETGRLTIDVANNALYYGDDAVIINVSAFSIKELYANHSTNLLSRNLRYYIKKRDIDSSIIETINKCPETFWFKNNGITIICDDFSIDGKHVKLKNFSIVNGGQTTTLIHKSKEINKDNDLFLPCKIIKTIGVTEDEKNLFSLEIAKATNSQKAIKSIDLKANAPEQVRFATAMRNAGLFYQTKRGEEIPKDFKEDYKNTDLVEVGKLCLAGIFQLPAASRNKPSTLYLDKYYNPVFNTHEQDQICSIVKELLYIDSYFRKTFISKFDKDYENDPNSSEIIPFAHNARTICISFVMLASRYYYKNITDIDLKVLFEYTNKEKSYDDYFYEFFKNLDGYNSIFPKRLFENKDMYDNILHKLFEIIIFAGSKYYSIKKEADSTLT